MSEIPPAPLPVPELSKPTVEDHVQKEPEKSQIMNALVRKELNLGFILFYLHRCSFNFIYNINFQIPQMSGLILFVIG